MNYLGIHLTLLIGPTIAAPAPPILTGALESVEVTHRDEGRSGFQLTFRVGRSGPADLLDYALLSSPLLDTHNRVITTHVDVAIMHQEVISNPAKPMERIGVLISNRFVVEIRAGHH